MDSEPFPDTTRNGDGVVRNVLGVNGFMARKDSTDGREHVAQYTIPPGEAEESEGRTYHYTDKNVMDCDVPKLVAFFQESNYQVVKDICIDRGVPSQDKCLVENCELDHNSISCLLNINVDTKSELTKEALDTVSSISNGSKSFTEHDCNKDVVKQYGSEKMMREGEVDVDARQRVAIDGSTKRTAPKPLHLVREFDTNCSHSQLSNSIGLIGEQKSEQVPGKEAVLANSMVSSETEAINSNGCAIKAPFTSEVESGSSIHDFDSSLPEISSREEGPQNADCQQPLETENMSRLQYGMSESLTVSNQSSIFQHHYGESSFSAVGPLSGAIAYSGHISYSGSVSLRSNSSTASAQSFAFPILPSEWNSSPVRMVKANQRQTRKHRRWSISLLCCKF